MAKIQDIDHYIITTIRIPHFTFIYLICNLYSEKCVCPCPNAQISGHTVSVTHIPCRDQDSHLGCLGHNEKCTAVIMAHSGGDVCFVVIVHIRWIRVV